MQRMEQGKQFRTAGAVEKSGDKTAKTLWIACGKKGIACG